MSEPGLEVHARTAALVILCLIGVLMVLGGVAAVSAWVILEWTN